MHAPSVAVVVPMHKATLSAAEELSLRSLRHHLSGHPLIVVAPKGAGVALEGFSTHTFPGRYFAGRHKYSELLVSRRFYQAFEQYTYILIYQLDCLIFSDQLGKWCELGYDYIGAPWSRRTEDGRVEFTGVGNGGFSLRRVQSCLEVLRIRDRQRRWSDRLAVAADFSERVVRSAGRGVRAVLRAETKGIVERSRRSVRAALHQAVPEYRNEDLFWARAPELLPTFRIPQPGLAVSFSFESEPRFCYEYNKRNLPFGCHQWQAYDGAFWEPHLAAATGMQLEERPRQMVDLKSADAD